MSIVRFGDGASAFCWLEQRWLAPTDYQFTLSLVSPWLLPPFFFFFLIFFSIFFVLLIFKFFFSSSSFLSFLSFVLFYFLLSLFFYFLSLLISFPLSFSPLELFLIWVCVLVMSIDSKFVFEFIVMLVHSTCQKCIHVRAWLVLRVVHESTTFKGMH